jgi:beta-barrel assembly-enhancing protease
VTVDSVMSHSYAMGVAKADPSEFRTPESRYQNRSRRQATGANLAEAQQMWRRKTTVGFAVLLAATVAAAQTRITPPPNNYTPAQDVELGLKAAAEAEQQLPIMHDDAVSSYLEDIGHRLVAAIPPDLQHAEFQYTFKPVNVREINAFALPGGPMFVNRGMLEKAHAEGEIAGVMAHELSHVVLRHGTAQASKAQRYQVGEIAGAVLGAIIGGRLGNVVASGTQFGVGAAFLRFSREYEKQADLEGTHIMARAGYDPRDMANIFKTIEQESGPGGPQWLSDHPNPGNRYEYISHEAQLLRVNEPVRDTRAFEQIQTHLRRLPPAPSTEEATKAASRNADGRASGPAPSGNVPPPSDRFSSYRVGNLLRVAVPSNWRQLQSTSAVTFAPEGAYGSMNGRSVFTHGIEIGVARNETHDLETATDELLQSLSRGNPRLGRSAGYRPTTIGNRRGLETAVSNVSEATGREETIDVFTTLLSDGNLLYVIGVAPRGEYENYAGVFQQIVQSMRLTS